MSYGAWDNRGGDPLTTTIETLARGRKFGCAYLPGCIATGKTRREIGRMIREAIEFHLEGLRLRGESIPKPTIEAGKVTVG